MNPIKRYIEGFNFLFKGTRSLFKIPGVLIWSMIPFIIVGLLLYFGLSAGLDQVEVYAQSAVEKIISPESGIWFKIVFYPLYFIFVICFTALFSYLLFLITSLVASPFNAVVAEKVLIHQGVIPDRKLTMAVWISISLKMFWVSLIRTVLFVFIGLFIFISSFLPGINLLAAFAGFLIIAFDCMDYSMEARTWTLRERFKYFKKNFMEFSGMASVLGLTLMVPGLTLIMLPSSVIGAALIMESTEKR